MLLQKQADGEFESYVLEIIVQICHNNDSTKEDMFFPLGNLELRPYNGENEATGHCATITAYMNLSRYDVENTHSGSIRRRKAFKKRLFFTLWNEFLQFSPLILDTRRGFEGFPTAFIADTHCVF